MTKTVYAVIALLLLFGALCTIEQRPDIALRCISLSCIPVFFGKLWEWKGGTK